VQVQEVCQEEGRRAAFDDYAEKAHRSLIFSFQSLLSKKILGQNG